jgi:PemK-like, MazF-like toxin of type II toxin-antitoxin system
MTTSYSPQADGLPDPGEVVWTWVAYEDDPTQGKDRPVLVVGRDRTDLLCLQLTSKDHDRDVEDEARHGRHWLDIGSGAWDREQRPSEVRLDRLLRLPESAVRREGAAVSRAVFDTVVASARQHHSL